MFALADDVANAALDAIKTRMDRRKGGAKITIYSGAKELAVLPVPKPSAEPAKDRTLTLNQIKEARAINGGNATHACCRDGLGDLVWECDVGTKESDASLKLNTTDIKPGGPVIIESFVMGS